MKLLVFYDINNSKPLWTDPAQMLPLIIISLSLRLNGVPLVTSLTQTFSQNGLCLPMSHWIRPTHQCFLSLSMKKSTTPSNPPYHKICLPKNAFNKTTSLEANYVKLPVCNFEQLSVKNLSALGNAGWPLSRVNLNIWLRCCFTWHLIFSWNVSNCECILGQDWPCFYYA